MESNILLKKLQPLEYYNRIIKKIFPKASGNNRNSTFFFRCSFRVGFVGNNLFTISSMFYFYNIIWFIFYKSACTTKLERLLEMGTSQSLLDMCFEVEGSYRKLFQ